MRSAAGICCFARSTGRVLLLKRSREVTKPGMWGFPGGRIDRGERPLEAAMREMHEEAGYAGPYTITAEVLLHPLKRPFHCFIAEAPRQFRPQLNWEHDDAGWFHPHGAGYRMGRGLPAPLHPGVLQLLDAVGVR
jgi:8-oxo-dGTP pyrophosphatase MutT (NUDIX family)